MDEVSLLGDATKPLERRPGATAQSLGLVAPCIEPPSPLPMASTGEGGDAAAVHGDVLARAARGAAVYEVGDRAARKE